jgi:hypothetical protein
VLDPPKSLSPLAPSIAKAKALCDAHGAALVVLVLPLDVQVSPAEWAKYGAAPQDVSSTKILVDDIAQAALDVGAPFLDATPALAAAEPGAFLDGDIHMTPKGHAAVAASLASALSSPTSR